MDSKGYLHHLTPEQAKQFEVDNRKPLMALSEDEYRHLQPEPPRKRKNWDAQQTVRMRQWREVQNVLLGEVRMKSAIAAGNGEGV